MLSETIVGILADAVDAGGSTARSSLDALASIADRLDERVLVLDAAAGVCYANTAARRDFGIAIGGVVGAPVLPSSLGGDADADGGAWAVRARAAGRLVVHARPAPGDDPASLRAAHERESARSAEYEILAAVNRALAALGSDADGCCRVAADMAGNLVCAAGVLISRVDGDDGLTFRGVSGSGALADAGGSRIPADALTGAPSRIRIVNAAAHGSPADNEILSQWGARQAMVAPLVVDGQLAGSIAVVNSIRGGFSARDGELLTMLADRLAITVNAGSPGRAGGRRPAPPVTVTDALRRQRHQRSVGELLPGVVHDLNNPLTGVSAFAELLQEEPSLDDSARDAVSMIRKEALRAIRIIKDVLHFARPATHAGTSGVDINAIVEATLRLRGYLIRGASIQVSTQLEPELPRVRGDAQQLQAALMHVFANAEEALAAVPAGQRELRVATIRRGNDVVISVADTGAGMSPETQRRMFEPFFTTRPADAGAGLGLSIVSGIVESHGGAIAVHSKPGAGARLEICFPSTVTVPVATPEPVS